MAEKQSIVIMGDRTFAGMAEQLRAADAESLIEAPADSFTASSYGRATRKNVIEARLSIMRLVKQGKAKPVGKFHGTDGAGRQVLMPHFILTRKPAK